MAKLSKRIINQAVFLCSLYVHTSVKKLKEALNNMDDEECVALIVLVNKILERKILLSVEQLKALSRHRSKLERFCNATGFEATRGVIELHFGSPDLIKALIDPIKDTLETGIRFVCVFRERDAVDVESDTDSESGSVDDDDNDDGDDMKDTGVDAEDETSEHEGNDVTSVGDDNSVVSGEEEDNDDATSDSEESDVRAPTPKELPLPQTGGSRKITLPYTCDLCGKRFATSRSCAEHRNRHIPYSEKAFVCTVCGKRYTSSSALSRHRRMHGIR